MSEEVKYSIGFRNINGYNIFYPRIASLDDLNRTTPPDPYAESATALFPLGTKIQSGDDIWRYCKNGAVALNIAAPIQSAARAHAEQDDDIVVAAAAAIGATEVSLTSTANLDTAPNDEVDNFKGGKFYVNDEAGEGQSRLILSNDKFSGTGNSTFKLADPLTIALTTSSQVGLVKSPYSGVIVSAAVATGMAMGAPEIAVTANYYFWSRTGGIGAVVPNAAIALGTWAVIGTTSGKVDPAAALTTELIVGYPVTPAVADTESFLMFWILDR